MARRTDHQRGSLARDLDSMTWRRLASLWPDAVEVHPDALAVGDRWVRALAVRGWPREVRPGWWRPLLEAPFAHVVVMGIEPLASGEQVARLTRRLIWNQGAAHSREQLGRLPDAAGQTAVADAHDLRRELARGATRMLRVGLGVVLLAPTREELDRRSHQVMTLAESLMLPLRPCRFQQVEAFRAALPGGFPTRGAREMDTRAAATLFPWMGDDIQHRHGQVWGENPLTQSLVVIDRQMLPAPHSLTVAWSGAGKSFATKLLILRARYHGVPVLVVDPEGEYGSLADPQQVVRVGQGVGLNPFRLYEAGPTEGARRADFVLRWLEALGVRLPRRGQDSVKRQLLGLGDLSPAEWLGEVAETDREMADRVSVAVEEWTAVMGVEGVPLPETGLTVVDLSGVPASIKVAAYLVAVEHVVATLRQATPRWVVFDEAWHLLANPKLAPYLEELYRRARKWRTALALVTQDAHDGLRSVSAQVCLRNSPLVLLLRPHPDAVPELAQVFHLTRPETELLEAAGVGEGLLLVDRERIPIRILPSPTELNLIKEGEARAVGV